MADVSQGEGWWLASDGKWYPPKGLPPPPVTASLPALTGQRKSQRQAAWIMVASAGAVCLASFLPWAVVRAPFVGQISKAGIEGDGVFSLLLGVGLAVCGIRFLNAESTPSARSVLVSAALSLSLLGLSAVEIVDIESTIDELDEGAEFVSVTVGTGLHVLILASGVAGLACFLMALAARSAPLE